MVDETGRLTWLVARTVSSKAASADTQILKPNQDHALPAPSAKMKMHNGMQERVLYGPRSRIICLSAIR